MAHKTYPKKGEGEDAREMRKGAVMLRRREEDPKDGEYSGEGGCCCWGQLSQTRKHNTDEEQ